MRLLCASMVAASCLMSPEKNEQNTELCDNLIDTNNGLYGCEALNFSNATPSMDTEYRHHSIQIEFCAEYWIPPDLHNHTKKNILQISLVIKCLMEFFPTKMGT